MGWILNGWVCECINPILGKHRDTNTQNQVGKAQRHMEGQQVSSMLQQSHTVPNPNPNPVSLSLIRTADSHPQSGNLHFSTRFSEIRLFLSFWFCSSFLRQSYCVVQAGLLEPRVTCNLWQSSCLSFSSVRITVCSTMPSWLTPTHKNLWAINNETKRILLSRVTWNKTKVTKQIPQDRKPRSLFLRAKSWQQSHFLLLKC